jgi:hypothetical protein
VGRHRTELTQEQIAEFESLAGHELERLGYPLSRVGEAPRAG